MIGQAPSFVPLWTTVEVGFDVTGAIALASAALWLVPRRYRFGTAGAPMVAALVLTALWCISKAVASASDSLAADFVPSLAESARNLAWLVTIYRLFASDGRHASLAPIRPVIISLGFVEVLHLAVDYGFLHITLDREILAIAFEFGVLFRLLVYVGGLVLAHNLYAGAPREIRAVLRWPACGLALLWAYDLNLYTVAYLTGGWPTEIAAFRGIASAVLAFCIVIGGAKNSGELRLKPSRAVTFQTVSLLVIGFYLVAMVVVAQWLSNAGDIFARLVELAFLTVGSAVALVILPSGRVRAWLKVITAKHLFQHRYDYREEWLRFANTIGSNQSAPLGERVVQSIADVFDSPAGLLLTPSDSGDLILAARWNWPEIEVPGLAMPQRDTAHFERTGYIVDLDDVRKGSSAAGSIPSWLIDHPRAWSLIPLVHYERLVGMVLLARPHFARQFDWEDLDLLRVIGQQAATYLSESVSQNALAESARFDDFNRRIAFVMHDIKNLASQFSLLARNAELHAEKPAFRADMLVTLRNSSDKLNALLARLSRYGSGGIDRLEDVCVEDILNSVAARFASEPLLEVTGCGPGKVKANRHSLEQVLVHLVQNAIDASATTATPVRLSVKLAGFEASFEIVDQGVGMSAEFVRSRLFKPFVSTKAGGFGIGAFEARELVKAMHGSLDVESREGAGSRFTVRLPVAKPEPITTIPAEKVA